MAQRGWRASERARKSAHEDLDPTRRVVVIETARATVVAALLGCAAALVLDALAMIVTTAFLRHAAATPERLGRGILAVASIGVVLALLAGLLCSVSALSAGSRSRLVERGCT